MNILCSTTKIVSAFAIILAVTSTTSSQSHAQNLNRNAGVGVPSLGTDMWTQAMAGRRLFTPHRDNCNTTNEFFVEVYTDGNSVEFGFCIDKDEHSAGLLQWEDARDTCMAEGKRLPEPGEWRFACDTLALNQEKDDAEWISNFTQFFRNGTSNSGIVVPISGVDHCARISQGWAGRNNIFAHNLPFRCVR